VKFQVDGAQPTLRFSDLQGPSRERVKGPFFV
jgi:hypothetical protein